MVRPTYKYQDLDTTRVTTRCPLCGVESELTVHQMRVEAKANFLIPMGSYREQWAECRQCEKRYPISEDLDQVLVPSKKARRLHTAAWLTLPIPFLSLALMILALKEAPPTANETRMWSLIGLVPSSLIALALIGFFLSV